MKVCEIFTSIQGESTRAGMPCTFVRFTGCNLRCSYCDTTYAYEEGVDYGIDELFKEVSMRSPGLVEFTGGEPLLQGDLPVLIERLLDDGQEVLVETNGSLGIGGLDKRAVVIMDVKTPGSGEEGSTELSNIELLKPGDEVKFVLDGRADYEWAREFVFKHSLIEKSTVLFSPLFGVLDPSELAGWILEDRIRVRLNLQLHKYIFGPHRRGV